VTFYVRFRVVGIGNEGKPNDETVEP